MSGIARITCAFVMANTGMTKVTEPGRKLLQPEPAACTILPQHNFYPFTFSFRLTEQQLSCLYSPPQPCSTSRIKLSSFMMSFSPGQHFP